MERTREALRQRQRRLGLSDPEFAALLGRPRTTWLVARREPKRALGRELVAAAWAAFADLRPLIEEEWLALIRVPAGVTSDALRHEGGGRGGE